MKRIFYFLSLQLVMVVVTGCTVDDPYMPPASGVGYVPIYGSVEQTAVKLIAPRDVNNPGRIYVYHQFLLVNEIDQGIHLFDNTDPASPKNLGFIQMLGNTDMAIRDNILYSDHLGSLVALAVADFAAIEEKGRLKLQQWNMGLPPPKASHFECIDPVKGWVVGWIKSENKNFDCYAW